MNARGLLAWLKTHAWVRIVISLALLGAFVLLLPTDRILRALHAINPVFLLSILPLYVLIHLVGAWKWRLLVNQAGGSLTLVRAANCYFAGLFGNLFLPSIVGGDMVMVGVAFKQGEQRSSVLMGSFMNRALDVLALVVLTCLGGVLLPQHLSPESRRMWSVVLWLSAAGIVTAGSIALLIRPNRLPEPLGAFLVKHEPALATLRRPSLIALPLAMSLLAQTGLTVIVAWIGKNSGLDLPFSVWLFAWSLAKVVALLPITLSGIGARELALVALLKPFGAAAEPVLAVGLAWDAILIGGGLLGGVISMATGWVTPAAPAEVKQ